MDPGSNEPAIDEIRQVVAAGSLAHDEHDPERFVAFVAPDAVFVDSSGRHEGRDEIACLPWPDRPVRQHLTTISIQLTTGDTATGRVYFIEIDDRGLVRAGIYVDEYTRVDGKWLIQQRTLETDYTDGDPERLDTA